MHQQRFETNQQIALEYTLFVVKIWTFFFTSTFPQLCHNALYDQPPAYAQNYGDVEAHMIHYFFIFNLLLSVWL